MRTHGCFSTGKAPLKHQKERKMKKKLKYNKLFINYLKHYSKFFIKNICIEH